MSKSHVGLIWSPRSNIALYGTTTDVLSAKAAGVTIGIAPDWSPTGSSGMLNELHYAAQWNRWQTPKVFDESELVRMATIVPAQLAHVDAKIGSIEVGHYADLIVLRSRPGSAYHAIVESGPVDLRLAIVDGEPVYGEPSMMAKLLPRARLETHLVCGEQRALNLTSQGSGDSLVTTEHRLGAALKAHKTSLAPLQECP